MSLLVNAMAILSLFIFGWIFLGIAFTTEPKFTIQIFVYLIRLPTFLLILLLIMIVHEACHGVLFLFFTKERPKLAFNLLYASTAAPGWFFPRNQYILIGAAPFVILTAVGLVWMSQASLLLLPKLILALTVNAAGSIGDLLVVIWLLSQPADTYVFDEGEFITLYRSHS